MMWWVWMIVVFVGVVVGFMAGWVCRTDTWRPRCPR